MKRLLLSCLLLSFPNLAAAQDNACMGSTSVDSCVVGSWALASGGPIAWMQGLCGMIADATQNKVEGRGSDVRATVTYHADGSYEATASGFRMDLHSNAIMGTSPSDHVVLKGDLQPATGRWSVSGTTLNNCQDSGGLTGTTYKTDSYDRPTTNVPGMGDISMEYSCSDAALKTSMSMGFITGDLRLAMCSTMGGADGVVRNAGDEFPMVMEFVKVE